jgi:hypothetical protein
VERKGEKITRVKYWESIADKLSKGGWCYISAIYSRGRTKLLLKLASSPPSTSLPTLRIESDSIQAHEKPNPQNRFYQNHLISR